MVPVRISYEFSFPPNGSTDCNLIYGAFTRSSKRPAIHVCFEYICWKFAGRLLDRVNILLKCIANFGEIASVSGVVTIDSP